MDKENSCNNCRYGKFLENAENPVAGAAYGNCRLNPPASSAQPSVARTDWCGKWEGRQD